VALRSRAADNRISRRAVLAEIRCRWVSHATVLASLGAPPTPSVWISRTWVSSIASIIVRNRKHASVLAIFCVGDWV
jgi:hypothetical protein